VVIRPFDSRSGAETRKEEAVCLLVCGAAIVAADSIVATTIRTVGRFWNELHIGFLLSD